MIFGTAIHFKAVTLYNKGYFLSQNLSDYFIA